MADIGDDRKVHIIEPAPSVPATPEPLVEPATPARPGAPAPIEAPEPASAAG